MAEGRSAQQKILEETTNRQYGTPSVVFTQRCNFLDAKKDKEQMELAQQQLENRIGRKIKDTPEEQEKIIQSIMESMIEDDDRLREAAKKRRNAFEILPALEDFDRDFAASTQVCCSALG